MWYVGIGDPKLDHNIPGNLLIVYLVFEYGTNLNILPFREFVKGSIPVKICNGLLYVFDGSSGFGVSATWE